MFADEGLEILDTGQCLALAATRPVGRVAVTVGALPAVFPVNYCLVDSRVYFRTGAGTKLDAATATPWSRSRWTTSTPLTTAAGAC